MRCIDTIAGVLSSAICDSLERKTWGNHVLSCKSQIHDLCNKKVISNPEVDLCCTHSEEKLVDAPDQAHRASQTAESTHVDSNEYRSNPRKMIFFDINSEAVERQLLRFWAHTQEVLSDHHVSVSMLDAYVKEIMITLRTCDRKMGEKHANILGCSGGYQSSKMNNNDEKEVYLNRCIREISELFENVTQQSKAKTQEILERVYEKLVWDIVRGATLNRDADMLGEYDSY